MAKVTEQVWAKAKALYEKGTSLRAIELETDIPYKTIDNRAKKNAWQKGSLAQLIDDTVRVKAEFGTLNLAQQEIVSAEVDQRTKHIQFFSHAAVTNVKQAMSDVCDGQADYQRRADTINKGREAVLGKTPETAIQINTGTPLPDMRPQLTKDEWMQAMRPNAAK